MSLRDAIARHAAALPLMGARWPAAWDAAARALGELPGLTVTTRRAFRRMAHAGVPDPAAQQAIARMLHDLGQIAYFAGIPDLATKIILKPEWLDARITQVIDSPPVTDAGGVLSRAERSPPVGGPGRRRGRPRPARPPDPHDGGLRPGLPHRRRRR